MSGEKTVGQDVRFQSRLCWMWCPNNDDDIHFNAECIDGETGFLHSSEKDDNCAYDDITHSSLVSTHALTNQFLDLAGEILQNVGDVQGNVTSLKELRALKRAVAPRYENIKDELLLNHGIFYNWNRRHDDDDYSKRIK